MGDSPPGSQHHEETEQTLEELQEELEKLIEDLENVSVELTWMTYDMVVLRTAPEPVEGLRRLKEEALKCCATLGVLWQEDVGELPPPGVPGPDLTCAPAPPFPV
nr:PREDICTED: synaptonemal complex central element protein 3 [Lepisosteus oculatus]